MSASEPTPKVYAAISAVQALLAKEGISKGRKNTSQNYAFRGIDDIYNAIANFLAQEKLVIIPRCTNRTVTERESKQGGALFYVVVDVEFDFVCALDGSKHTARMLGEAMDSGDKATNKAMSAAYKYCCLQTFCIPTEADNDADATTHEPKAKAASRAKADPLAGAGQAAQVPSRWQDCVIHFGKNKGKKLGDLPANTLGWYITEWAPKPGYTSDQDTVLRQMLDKAADELDGASTAGATAGGEDEIPM